MASHRRALNALVAVGTVTLVAAVLATFGRGGASGRPIRTGPTTAAVAEATTSARPSTAALPTTTVASSTPSSSPGAAPTSPSGTAPPLAPPAPPAPVDSRHRWAVGTISFTLVDASRPTPAATGDPGSPARTLPTIVRYPVDGPAATPAATGAAGSRVGAPFPLVVFAQGFDTTSAIYTGLLDSWTAAGYVVAAPAFPRSTAGGPLNEGDVDNQPGDLSFTITRVLALAAAGGPLAGLVDGNHVGVAGHSDGASTTGGIGYNSCCRDPRVQADAVMEGDEHPFPGGHWSPVAAPPLLVIQGDHDALNPPSLGQAVFNDSRKPKYLLWLVNAQHLEPYTTDTAHLGVVSTVTVAFFDRFLKGRVDGVTGMQRGASPGLAALTVG